MEESQKIQTPVESPAIHTQDAQFEAEPTKSFRIQPVHLVAVFVAGLLAGGVIGYVGNSLLGTGGTEQTAAAQSAAGTDEPSSTGPTLMDAVIEQTRHFKGDPDAPVTIIEFSDFRCPYCGRYAAETSPQIEETYVEQGIVRVGFYSLAFLSPESQSAAEASECAADQEAFWEYHDLLFERLMDRSVSFSTENLKQFAAELDLDTEAFNECLDSGKYTTLVRSQTQSASSIGVQSTPTFLINGQPLLGAQPYEIFEQVIESER